MSKETHDFNEVVTGHETTFKDILQEGEEFVGHVKKNYTDLETLKSEIALHTKDLGEAQNKIGPLKRDVEHVETDSQHHS
jgi:hypothetical protein